MNRPEYQSVGKSVRKKDSLQLLLGKPVYTDDIAPDALVVKLLRALTPMPLLKPSISQRPRSFLVLWMCTTWEDVA